MSISRTISIISIISISIIQKNSLYCWRKVKCYIDLKTPAPKPCCRSGQVKHPCSGESIQLNVYGIGPVHTNELTSYDKSN